MRQLTASIAALATLAGALSAPGLAEARHYYRHSRYHQGYSRAEYDRARWSCERARRRNANNGTVIGAVGGGLVGHAIGGHGIGGTLLGAGVGAVAGHQIAKSRKHC